MSLLPVQAVLLCVLFVGVAALALRLAAATERASKASCLGPACAAGLLAAGCPDTPMRPVPKECPAAAINEMKALGIEPGAYAE